MIALTASVVDANEHALPFRKFLVVDSCPRAVAVQVVFDEVLRRRVDDRPLIAPGGAQIAFFNSGVRDLAIAADIACLRCSPIFQFLNRFDCVVLILNSGAIHVRRHFVRAFRTEPVPVVAAFFHRFVAQCAVFHFFTPEKTTAGDQRKTRRLGIAACPPSLYCQAASATLGGAFGDFAVGNLSFTAAAIADAPCLLAPFQRSSRRSAACCQLP